MQNTYNIYRMKPIYLPLLERKMTAVGLHQQKTAVSGKYNMTFYFSQGIEGSPIWWWQTYRDFFNDDVVEPTNKFHFALVIARTSTPSDFIYLVSLGKSHFYLSKFIERDFGINVAVRMASQASILLKKSRYFNSAKRQDISTYESFTPDSYLPGESVEHLKLKALDSEIWGEKSIIFADSIQMDTEKTPDQLSEIFDQIDQTLQSGPIINLPKLEAINDEAIRQSLDRVLTRALATGDGRIVLEEFEVFGIDFCFRFLNYSYQIYIRDSEGKKTHPKDLGNTLELQSVYSYLGELESVPPIESIKIQFKLENQGKFTKSLKELIDFYVRADSVTYFLRDGEWFAFNQVFMNYLRRSLLGIQHVPSEALVEDDFQNWKAQKISDIASGIDRGNRLTYREYYFNEKQHLENSFEIMDRELELIRSMESGRRDYKLEVADLYKDGEIIAVKISEDEKELIYNIEQSKDAVTLLAEGEVATDRQITGAALWFVLEEEIQSITEFNSIQFLLAVSSWQRVVVDHKLVPRIYISRHVRT